MKKIAFFDTKPYDREYFENTPHDGLHFKFYVNKLTAETAFVAKGCEGAVAFVNDKIDAEAINELCECGVKVLAMRCAGYNNIDLKAAQGKLRVVRVPNYSPYAVAEHTMALLLCLNRKLHRAFNRTRDYNFSINGLTGFDLRGKTAGVIGTGKIGQIFIEICKGFGMNILAYDPYPVRGLEVEYVTKEELFRRSDIISLHCPLTESTYHIIDRKALDIMKSGVYILNTSRGALIDAEDLLKALKDGRVGGAGLDVYEEESEVFFEDYSGNVIQDDILSLLVNMPNVIVTSHQAFLTREALSNIAEVTVKNLQDFFAGRALKNEIAPTNRISGRVKV